MYIYSVNLFLRISENQMSEINQHFCRINHSYELFEWTRTKKVNVTSSSLKELINFSKKWLNHPENSRIKIVLEEDGKFFKKIIID